MEAAISANPPNSRNIDIMYVLAVSDRPINVPPFRYNKINRINNKHNA